MREPFYDLPDDRADTVFDPYDETFGPIMAAIQAGDFEEAAAALYRMSAADRDDCAALIDAAYTWRDHRRALAEREDHGDFEANDWHDSDDEAAAIVSALAALADESEAP